MVGHHLHTQQAQGAEHGGKEELPLVEVVDQRQHRHGGHSHIQQPDTALVKDADYHGADRQGQHHAGQHGGQAGEFAGFAGRDRPDQQNDKADGQGDHQHGKDIPQGLGQFNLLDSVIGIYLVQKEKQHLQHHGPHDPPEDLVQNHVFLLCALGLLFFLVHVSISCGRAPGFYKSAPPLGLSASESSIFYILAENSPHCK